MMKAALALRMRLDIKADYDQRTVPRHLDKHLSHAAGQLYPCFILRSSNLSLPYLAGLSGLPAP